MAYRRLRFDRRIIAIFTAFLLPTPRHHLRDRVPIFFAFLLCITDASPFPHPPLRDRGSTMYYRARLTLRRKDRVEEEEEEEEDGRRVGPS